MPCLCIFSKYVTLILLFVCCCRLMRVVRLRGVARRQPVDREGEARTGGNGGIAEESEIGQRP